jgi:thiosulfate/3-mercaptopyruvate sulfurtransferase
VVDCRFDLTDVASGRRVYREGHIPRAIYADLAEDLSGTPLADRGRHPLPAVANLVALFGRLGIDRATQVVAYDDNGGAIAARLWWLLRYLGHDAVAILNGGMGAWLAAGLPVTQRSVERSPREFRGNCRRQWLVTVDQIPMVPRLVDSRDPARYRGETEPFDPVAGHIPGAVNYHFARNLDGSGRFLPAETIGRQLQSVLADTPSSEVVFYCGSGVNACHNLLAVVHAGYHDARLYAGSWSEWCRDPGRPVATGDEPSSL